MKGKKTSSSISKINKENISLSNAPQIIKDEHKKSTVQLESTETEEKIYLLGFMPMNEINVLVLGELGESVDLNRIKNLWLPKTKAVQELVKTDMRLLDDEKLNDVIKDIDTKYSKKIEEIEKKLNLNPFWQANKYSIKLVKIDELIALQGFVNIDRANKLSTKISKDVTMPELIDFTIDLDRKPDVIHHHQISNNAILFSTDNHDVRPGKIEVRQIPKNNDVENLDGNYISALIIPVIEGDAVIYCLKTFNFIKMPDGTQKRNYYLRIQNGLHRAYALRSLGIEYMPCLIVEPTSAVETGLLTGQWSPERIAQEISQRPPLMKDFFNPELTEKFQVRKTKMCIKVEWKIDKFTT